MIFSVSEDEVIAMKDGVTETDYTIEGLQVRFTNAEEWYLLCRFYSR